MADGAESSGAGAAFLDRWLAALLSLDGPGSARAGLVFERRAEYELRAGDLDAAARSLDEAIGRLARSDLLEWVFFEALDVALRERARLAHRAGDRARALECVAALASHLRGGDGLLPLQAASRFDRRLGPAEGGSPDAWQRLASAFEGWAPAAPALRRSELLLVASDLAIRCARRAGDRAALVARVEGWWRAMRAPERRADADLSAAERAHLLRMSAEFVSPVEPARRAAIGTTPPPAAERPEIKLVDVDRWALQGVWQARTDDREAAQGELATGECVRLVRAQGRETMARVEWRRPGVAGFTPRLTLPFAARWVGLSPRHAALLVLDPQNDALWECDLEQPRARELRVPPGSPPAWLVGPGRLVVRRGGGIALYDVSGDVPAELDRVDSCWGVAGLHLGGRVLLEAYEGDKYMEIHAVAVLPNRLVSLGHAIAYREQDHLDVVEHEGTVYAWGWNAAQVVGLEAAWLSAHEREAGASPLPESPAKP
jgi:hypothetical protein